MAARSGTCAMCAGWVSLGGGGGGGEAATGPATLAILLRQLQPRDVLTRQLSAREEGETGQGKGSAFSQTWTRLIFILQQKIWRKG